MISLGAHPCGHCNQCSTLSAATSCCSGCVASAQQQQLLGLIMLVPVAQNLKTDISAWCRGQCCSCKVTSRRRTHRRCLYCCLTLTAQSCSSYLPSFVQQVLQRRPKGTECDTLDFRKSMLTRIKEMPLIGLFGDIKGQTK